MSWMDSWSRPSKNAAFPPPIYLTTAGPIPYCHTCGRVMSPRKNTNAAAAKMSTPVKYCSSRCRGSKPGPVDRKIEDAFAALLNDDLKSFEAKYPREEEGGENVTRIEDGAKVKKGKGDTRVIVWCSEVEELVFGSRFDAGKTAGRRKNRAPRSIQVDGREWRSVDMESGDDDDDEDVDHTLSDSERSDELPTGAATANDEVDPEHRSFGAGKKRPEQRRAEVNGSVGGEKGWAEKIEESPEMLRKRLEGQRRAEEREMVRRAARRGVAFGLVVVGDEGRKSDGRGSGKGAGAGGGKKAGGKGRKTGGEEDQVKDEDSKEERRLCEAVITKAVIVVEPSFAKGDWGIRWREQV